MKIVALAGGVGGAKFVDGLAQNLASENLTIIVNTGDDFYHLGLKICPDLDTVCYTLAGIANPYPGWGRLHDTWHVMENIAKLGGPDWFRLGDMDLATHLERTRRLMEGQRLSEITQDFCQAWMIGPKILPMSDDSIPTIVLTDEGELPFQEYFVHRQCEPRVNGFRFQGVGESIPAPGVVAAIRDADLILICPSNPWVSIDPIFSVPTLKSEIQSRPVIAISPIIGGKAVKGPVVKMYAELGIQPSALAVAHHYSDLLDGFIFDQIDQELESDIQTLNVLTYCTDTIMTAPEKRKSFAHEVLNFGKLLLENEKSPKSLSLTRKDNIR